MPNPSLEGFPFQYNLQLSICVALTTKENDLLVELLMCCLVVESMFSN